MVVVVGVGVGVVVVDAVDFVVALCGGGSSITVCIAAVKSISSLLSIGW